MYRKLDSIFLSIVLPKDGLPGFFSRKGFQPGTCRAAKQVGESLTESCDGAQDERREIGVMMIFLSAEPVKA
jgi:hypothetical protein